MMSLSQLLETKQVVYHASCPDGTASAMICARALQTVRDIDFLSIQHGTEFMEKLEPRPGQLFVDITPPHSRWEEWKLVGPVVLDHHAGPSESVTKALGGTYATNDAHSGAMLAFENVLRAAELFKLGHFDPKEVEEWRDFAELAMIRDTWKKDHPRWKDACAQALALQFRGSKPLVEKVRASSRFDFSELMHLGRLLLGSNERRTELLADGAFVTQVTDGEQTLNVGIFNCSEQLVSDVANYLIEQRGCDIGVGYFYLFEDGQQKMVVSVRTNGKASAAKICQTFGGGGHFRAAGFRINDANSTPPGSLTSYIEAGIRSAK